MATTTATFTLGSYPDGVEESFNKQHWYGTVALGSGGTYVTNGLPLTFKDASLLVYTPKPFFGHLFSLTSGLTYEWDPTNQTIRIFLTYGTEATNGASITADTLQAHFVCNRDSSPTG